MRDTTNILLECDLRQAEVALLVRIVQEDPLLLSKLVKEAIAREVADAVDPDGLFWVATPNVFVLMSFFTIVARPMYIAALQPVLDDLINKQANKQFLENGFPTAIAKSFLTNIAKSASSAPSILTEICAFLYETLSKKFPSITKAQAVQPLVIFRGFENILMKPQIYGLVPGEKIKPLTKQALVDISKSLTYLATGRITESVGAIDAKLLDFINAENVSIMRSFLVQLVDNRQVSSPSTSPHTSPVPSRKGDGGTRRRGKKEEDNQIFFQTAASPTSLTRAPSETLDSFREFLEKILVRVDAAGMNRNHRVHSLVRELHVAVEKSGKMDVDIHRADSSKDLHAESTLSRMISMSFLQPKTSTEVLEVAKGKLIDDIAFKITYKDTICFSTIPKSKVSYRKLRALVQKTFYTDELTIRYMDADGDYVPITDSESLMDCIEKSNGLTVKLALSNEITIIPKGDPDQSATQQALADIEKRLRAQYPNEEFFRESFVISDPLQPDNPLIYVNDGFEKLTFYPSEEILGKNCRFLQGKDSDQNEINKLSKAIKDGVDVKIELINYRKDGKPFWNRFHVFPLRDAKNVVTNFVAVQQDITHIRQRARNPREWTPTDVADWLKFMHLSDDCAAKFEERQIDGKQLLALSPEKMTELGLNEKQSEKITSHITEIIGTAVPAASAKIPVKVYFESEAHITKVKPTIALRAFVKKIEKLLQVRHLPTVILYENQEKEKLAFVHTKELTQQLLQARLKGESFKVWVDFFDLFYMH
eukprot:Phypoly_transcript_01902.p1 GENE.Phypoly_transcript_01902~~Phypoly_transcript_01902.p1  ORF type:complete len:765 (-),score=133.57 Phypoly_transcript_01902:226-2520(-)